MIKFTKAELQAIQMHLTGALEYTDLPKREVALFVGILLKVAAELRHD